MGSLNFVIVEATLACNPGLVYFGGESKRFFMLVTAVYSRVEITTEGFVSKITSIEITEFLLRPQMSWKRKDAEVQIFATAIYIRI